MRCTSLERALMMMMGVYLAMARARRQISSPSMPGNIRSSTSASQ